MVLVEKYGNDTLEVLFVGHNPSTHSWDSGHYFSQPSNRFWKLLVDSGLVSRDENRLNDDFLLENYGFGFADVIREPNSDASSITRAEFIAQRSYFYKRILINANRVGAPPKHVAFVGKRQFAMLFDPPLKRVDLGLQEVIPPKFPFTCQIWVLSSPSGRAVMNWESRLKPYSELAETMQSAFPTSNIE